MEPLTLALLAGGALLLARTRRAPGGGGVSVEGLPVSSVLVNPKGEVAARDVIGTLEAGETIGLSRTPTDRPIVTLTGTADPRRAVLQVAGLRVAVDPTAAPGFVSQAGKYVGPIVGSAAGFIAGGPAGSAAGSKIGTVIGGKVF